MFTFGLLFEFFYVFWSLTVIGCSWRHTSVVSSDDGTDVGSVLVVFIRGLIIVVLDNLRLTESGKILLVELTRWTFLSAWLRETLLPL